MAFTNKNLSVVACVNDFTIWHYKTDDQLNELLNGYFNPVQDLMNKNDLMILNAGDINCIMFIKEIQNKNVKLG